MFVVPSDYLLVSFPDEVRFVNHWFCIVVRVVSIRFQFPVFCRFILVLLSSSAHNIVAYEVRLVNNWFCIVVGVVSRLSTISSFSGASSFIFLEHKHNEVSPGWLIISYRN